MTIMVGIMIVCIYIVIVIMDRHDDGSGFGI